MDSEGNSDNGGNFDIPAGGAAERSRGYQSIASRLFQFALSSTQPQQQAPVALTAQAQLSQHESYSRLREQLFPSRPGPPAPTNAHRRVPRPSSQPRHLTTMHPSFRTKAVCELGCNSCHTSICKRGMKAILLADTSVSRFLCRSTLRFNESSYGESRSPTPLPSNDRARFAPFARASNE